MFIKNINYFSLSRIYKNCSEYFLFLQSLTLLVMQARVSSATSAPLLRTRGSRQVSGPKTDSPRTGSRTGAVCTGPSRRRGTPRWSATVTRVTPRAPSVSRSSNRDRGASSGTGGGDRCSGGAPQCRTLE